jgi:hypothetical protein
MSVVLLEQLIEEVNSLEVLPKMEVYQGITETGLVEIGLIDLNTEKSLALVRAVQSPDLSHLECINQGASKIIDYVFSHGIRSILNGQDNGELEKGSTTLCSNNE